MKNNMFLFTVILLLIAPSSYQCPSYKTSSVQQGFVGGKDQLLIDRSEHGYVTNIPAGRW